MSHRIFSIIFLVLLFGCGSDPGGSDQGKTHASITAQDIADNNRGVGLMGSFKYSEAREVFQELSRRRPNWSLVKINLAIATLNLQTEGSEDRALAILSEVLEPESGPFGSKLLLGLALFVQRRHEIRVDPF